MKAGRWIVCTLCLTGLGLALVAGSSYALDIFGIFRNPAGRQLSVQYNERTAKLLLNIRYVPTDFDAVLIGGSSTSNLQMQALDFAHFYNESLYGANAVEEKNLLDRALPKAHFRYAICLLDPYLLSFHELNEGANPHPRRQALGSVNVLREEWFMLKRNLHHAASNFSPDGGQKMPPSRHIEDPFLTYTFQPDPIALAAYNEALNSLRARGVTIIFLRMPVYEPIFEKHQSQFDGFFNSIQLRQPNELYVDFSAPEYKSFREEADHWVDAPHMTDDAARTMSAELNRKIHEQISAQVPTLRQ